MLIRLVACIGAVILLCSTAHAQTGSSKTVSSLTVEVNTNWPDNTTGAITPFNARQTLLDIINSYFNVLSGNAPLPTVSSSSVIGNVSGVSAVATQITATQLTTLCNSFTPSLSGCVPNSLGGTVTFLRADGSWAVPPGTATGPAGSNTQVQYNNSGSFGASPDFSWIDPLLTLGANGINTGQLGFAGSASGKVIVQSQNTAGSWTLKWPMGPGTNGYVLTTDGTGVTSWTNPAGGGTVTNIATGGFLSGGPITTTGTITGAALGAPMTMRQGAL